MTAFVRSQTGSAIFPHSLGQGEPPKGKRKDIKAKSSSGICVHVCKAVEALRWARLKADLKSVFEAAIGRSGCLRLAIAAQLTSRWRQWPCCELSSWSSSTRLLTEVPDPKAKLRSWVSLSFSTMLPNSSMAFCFWIFIGAIKTFGMRFVFPRGKGNK